MDTKPSDTARCHIERVPEELYVPHTACNGLFAINFKVEFLLYEVSDALLDAFRRSRGLAEDYSIVSISHNRMSAILQLLVKFIENYIAKKRTERTALGRTDIALLHDAIAHDSCFQILVYQ